MRKYCLLVILVYASTCSIFGQSLNDGMYGENWERERDAINNGNQERQRWQEDYYYQQLKQQEQQRNAEIERRIKEAAAKAQNSGIQFTTDNSTVRTRSSGASKQKIQAQKKKAQREAEHRQWLEQKRAAQAAAAERERQRQERERIEQQRRYNEALANEYRRSADQYSQLHSNVDYKATEGFERMMYTQAEGTERLESLYVPSSNQSRQSNIVSTIAKNSGRKTVSLITLSGNEHSTLNSNWDQAMNNYFFIHQIKELQKISRAEWEIWEKLKSNWDDGQQAYMKYLLKSANDGGLPEILGINKENNYVFKSYDKNKYFVISEDGSTLKVVKYEDHSISDENLIKKIREEGFSMHLLVSKDLEIKGGYLNLYEEDMNWKSESSISYSAKDGKKVKKGDKESVKSINDLSDEDLYKLLPEIRKKYELTLFDNSSKMEGQMYYVSKQNDIAYGVTASFVVGGTSSITGGQKAEIEASGSFSLAKGAEVKVGGNVSVLEGGAEGTSGLVVGMGDKYYLVSVSGGADLGFGVGAEVKGGLKYSNDDVKAEGKLALPGASVKIKLGGALMKCLNCDSEAEYEYE